MNIYHSVRKYKDFLYQNLYKNSSYISVHSGSCYLQGFTAAVCCSRVVLVLVRVGGRYAPAHICAYQRSDKDRLHRISNEEGLFG